MRVLTRAEQRLLDSLPAFEGDVLRALFEECDARLVTEGDQRRGERISSNAPGPVASPSVTSQDALFQMRKADQ